MGEELPLNVKIKQEKLTPEREDTDTDPDDEIDRFLNSKPFGSDEIENQNKKNVEPAKTSDELLEELFGAIGAKDLLFKDESKKKKKKKRKHSDDEPKKSKKSKKVKEEPKSDGELSDDFVKKIKKEKKDKDHRDREVTEKRKLSIVIKDFKIKSLTTQDSSKDHREKRDKSKEKSGRDKREKSKDKKKDKDRDRSKEKKKSRDKKSNGSDFSLSDEETYRNYYEYHTSARWYDHHHHQRDPRGGRDWDRDKYYGRSRYDDDRYGRYDSRYRRRSRSRSRSRKHSPIDKKKLLEIARKNAISMLKSGMLPRISNDAKEKMMAKIRHGGKTIEELTNYCKKLSRAEDLGELSDLSDSDVDGEGMPRAFHHPFEVKDRGPIVMNIRNSVPIAPKQASEIKAIMSQFPVSSGKQHSLVENAWVPVTTSNGSASTSTTTTTSTSKSVVTLSKQIEQQLPELAKPKSKPVADINPVLAKPYDWKSDDHYCKSIVPAIEAPSQPPVDVSEIISQRLNAMRKLQENPNDVEASKTLYETQQNMSAWAASKYTPGQFLGSTEVTVLSQKELSSGKQAWARPDQLINTAPVTSGMGMHLLRKMGWTPGEGLGKEKNGSLTPLLLELKLDKRGLEANEEVLRVGAKGKGGKGGGAKGGKQAPISMDSLQQKHPVSLLGELASKRRWGAPNYAIVNESGPAHAKNFIFKIRLNGIDYTCPTPSNNKKEAKAAVARFTLQQLGILPP